MTDDDAMIGDNPYGFTWGPLKVQRLMSIPRDNGLCRVLRVTTEHQDVEIYVSPEGRSIRVFHEGRELK